ncbi:DUF6695 family protein [Aquimarina sp. W85]|uniref:DUF6695 family protein n=1 Tax=Aquimarina rhodophyticola TaxID=3342246 RepID=UPI00366E1F33
MNTGKIIVLAFPDTFVKYSDEFALRLFPFLGLGKNRYIKAGHAALVLIHNKSGDAAYYDFGRYMTPSGLGRVRSALTDVELELPMHAIFNEKGDLINLDEFLKWLESHPEYTHGEGRLVASLCSDINFEDAKKYLLTMQDQGSLPYRAFGRKGSNCSRLVTETLIQSTTNKRIKRCLTRIKLFTPSPLGNVFYASSKRTIYTVKDGSVQLYDKSVTRENLFNYFDKRIPKYAITQSKTLPLNSKNLFFLSGVGSSAFFYIREVHDKNEYIIQRLTPSGVLDFEGVFIVEKGAFDFENNFQIIYDSNCLYCHIEQENKIYKLLRIQRTF